MKKYVVKVYSINKSLLVEATGHEEIILKMAGLGIYGGFKISPYKEVLEISTKWERQMFASRKEAMDHAIATKRGTVKAQNGQWVWYAPKS